MHKRRLQAIAPLLIFLPFIVTKPVFAQESQEIVVNSEIMFGSQEEYVPEAFYEEGEELYRLRSWKLEPVTLDPREKHVEQEILYEEVEKKEMIPDIWRITSEEEFSGLKTEGAYPVLRIRQMKEEWHEDFAFPVVFHSYGADEYQLGKEVVKTNGEPLELADYEEALLSEIGVTSENYRITKTEWIGAPYMDEDDVLCRDAKASGKKKVATYLVAYGGTAIFPQIEGFRCRAIYRLNESEKLPAQEKDLSLDETAERPEKRKPFWFIKREAVVLAISLLLAIAILASAVWGIKRAIKRKTQSKEKGNGNKIKR